MPRIFIVLLLSATLCYAQFNSQTEAGASGKAKPGTAAATNHPKPTSEQLQRGHRMLELAESQASGLRSGMRAYALLQLARAYQENDKKKARQALEDGLAATRGIDADALHTKRQLQERLLQALVAIAPESADELLDQVMPEVRGAVLRKLLQYYKEHKDLDRAIQVLYRAGGESEIPYDAAAEIIATLPPERSADVLNIFTASLASYSSHEHRGGMMEGSDFADMIPRFWHKLPSETVLAAIAEVLKQAKAQAERDSGMNISMGSSKGAVAFSSFYDYRLFQLLPILRQLDESAAKRLLEEHQQVQTLLARYPQGIGSLNAGKDPNNPEVGFMSVTGGGSPAADQRRNRMPTPLEMQQMSKIIADADAHPQDALANAALIARPMVRAHTYEGIARSTARKNPNVAHQALEKFFDLIPRLDQDQQLRASVSVAEAYVSLAEVDSARKAVERGLKAADKAYEEDTNADNPNRALKAYWPSTVAYNKLLRIAAGISPAWAMQLAEQISDPEIKVVVEIALAQTWLGVPIGGTTIMSNTKEGPRIMMDVN